MIETENLTKKFGDITAVEGLTLHVKEGEVFGFLGPNGTGKTTTVRMLSYLISKTSGEARIGDYEIGKSEDCQRIRRMIGFLPENAGLYDALPKHQFARGSWRGPYPLGLRQRTSLLPLVRELTAESEKYCEAYAALVDLCKQLDLVGQKKPTQLVCLAGKLLSRPASLQPRSSLIKEG